MTALSSIDFSELCVNFVCSDCKRLQEFAVMWDNQPSTEDVQVIEINSEIELLPKDCNSKEVFLNEERCKDMLSKISENVNYLHLKTKSEPNAPEVDLEYRVTNGSLNDDKTGSIAIENVEIKKQIKQENEDEIQNSVIKIQNNNLRLVDDSDSKRLPVDNLNDRSTDRFTLAGPNQARQRISNICYGSTNADSSVDIQPGISVSTATLNYTSREKQEREQLKKYLSESALQSHIKPTVKVNKDRKFKDDCIYPICSKPRGYCLIINNVEFKFHQTRKGSDLEAKYLEEIFKQLDFQVLHYRNLTSTGMLECFKKIAKKPELHQHDTFVSIILTHGDDGRVVYGTDGSRLKIDKFLPCFTNENCPQLKNKPKLFFIQACRGRNHDFGAYNTAAATVSDAAPVKTSSSAVRKELKEENRLNDVLIVNSTLDGFVSLRNEISGSWFGDALGFALCEHSKDDELQRLLGLVSAISLTTNCFGVPRLCLEILLN